MPLGEREALEQALNSKFEGAVQNIRFQTLPNGKPVAIASVFLPWVGDWRTLSFTYTAPLGLEVWLIGGECGRVPGGFQVFEYEDLWQALKHHPGADFLNLSREDAVPTDQYIPRRGQRFRATPRDAALVTSTPVLFCTTEPQEERPDLPPSMWRLGASVWGQKVDEHGQPIGIAQPYHPDEYTFERCDPN